MIILFYFIGIPHLMTKTKTSVFTLIVTIAAIGLLTSSGLVSNEVNGQSTTVPTWIQNVANFWSNGEVSDDEFVNAMTFLVEEGIMDLPNVVSPVEAQTITSSLEDMNERLEKIEEQKAVVGTTIAPSPVEPPEDTTYPYTFAICPADKVRHFDKIQFKLKLDKSVSSVKGYNPLSSQFNNIVILEEGPDEVGSPFQLEDRLASHLGDLGYSHTVDNNSQKLHAFDLDIIDVEYAVICANKPGVASSGDSLGYK